VLNINELLQWCNAWKPTAATAADLQGIDSEAAAAAAAGGAAQRYTHTVCVAHEFGRHGKVDVAPTTSSSSSSSSGTTSSSSSSSSSGDSTHSWFGFGPVRLRQLLAKGRLAQTAAASANGHADGQAAHASLQQQQQQQQQWPGGDPELDPRALMTDLAVLDHAGE
jgi:hypothetical protein